MRWFWIDRFIEFQSGHHAVATKNVTLAEEHVIDYVPGFPVLPPTLVIEGMAQTGGILVAEQSDFRERVILAKIAQARFHEHPQPGDTLAYTVTMQTSQMGGTLVKGTSHISDRLHAEINLFFAQLDDRFAGVELFEPARLCQWLRSLRLFEVGKKADGTPLTIPAEMLAAERAALPPT